MHCRLENVSIDSNLNFKELNFMFSEGTDVESSTETTTTASSERSQEGGDEGKIGDKENDVQEKVDVCIGKERDEDKMKEEEEEEEVEVEEEKEDVLVTEPESSKPSLKHISTTSLHEEEDAASTLTSSATLPFAVSSSKLYSSPGLNRKTNVPPVTPPGNSPSIGRKRLMFTQRPLSKFVLCSMMILLKPVSLGAASGGDHGVRKEEDQFNNPSFVFLQLYGSRFLGDLSDHTPILLPTNEVQDYIANSIHRVVSISICLRLCRVHF